MNARTLYRRLFRAQQVYPGRCVVELHFDPQNPVADTYVLGTEYATHRLSGQAKRWVHTRRASPGVETQLWAASSSESVFKDVVMYRSEGVIVCLIKVYGSWRRWKKYGPTLKAIVRTAEALHARIRIPGPYEQWVGTR